jgi:hypothetical protein
MGNLKETDTWIQVSKSQVSHNVVALSVARYLISFPKRLPVRVWVTDFESPAVIQGQATCIQHEFNVERS